MSYRSVMEQIITNCENALLMRKPIILLDTDELVLVHRIADSDRLIVQLYNDNVTGKYQLYREVQSKVLQSKSSLFASSPVYKTYIHNVATYKSIDEFSKAVSKSSNKVYPGSFPYGSYSYNLDNYPALYLVCGTRNNENDDKLNGLYSYVDNYLSATDDNSHEASNCLIIYGEKAISCIPEALKPYCAYIEEPYPEVDEIISIINTIMQANDMELLDRDSVLELARSLSGFRLLEIERLIAYFIRCSESNKKSILYDSSKVNTLIIDEKEQMLKKDRVLELQRTDKTKRKSIDEIGGMNNFKHWLEKQKPSVVSAGKFMQETGGKPCKGVLMCGIPGCGKSLAAKTVADTMGLPLLKLDIGKLLGKFVGDSEHNLEKALKQAEAMSPCVLWIDEIEKGFSENVGSGSEVSARMFGYLLTWLQECTKPVFNFCTANNISKMPKEFFRSGRFDALYALFMPTYDEIIDIVSVRMRKLNNDFQKYGNKDKILFAEQDMTKESAKNIFDAIQINQEKKTHKKFRYMTGADVEKIMNMALRTLWNDGQYIVRSLKEFEPVITKERWIEHLSIALEDTKVYGDGDDNIGNIAANYIRLLKGNFATAAENPLFVSDDYVFTPTESDNNTKQNVVTIKDVNYNKDRPRNAYDKEFRELISNHMVRIGEEIESVQMDIISGKK